MSSGFSNLSQARRLEMSCGERFVPDPDAAASSANVMDTWILVALQGLVKVTLRVFHM